MSDDKGKRVMVWFYANSMRVLSKLPEKTQNRYINDAVIEKNRRDKK